MNIEKHLEIKSQEEFKTRLFRWQDSRNGQSPNKFHHQQIVEMVYLIRFSKNRHQEYTQCGKCIRKMRDFLDKKFLELRTKKASNEA